LFGGIVALALGLGYIGFSEYFRIDDIHKSPLDIFYLSLQLFVLGSGSVEGTVPWTLEVARLLAPAAAAYATIKALTVIFLDQFQLVKAKHLRDHVVIYIAHH
jgi:hypothetical protein